MFPRWLGWLFILFLGYIVVTGNRGLMHREAAPEKAARDERIAVYYPAIHALVDGERWKRAISPDYAESGEPCGPAARTEDGFGSYAFLDTQGVGDPAKCGEAIRFSATLWDAKGRIAKKIEGATLTLGEQEGLDALIVGMMVRETRTLVLPVPAKGYDALPGLKGGNIQLLTFTRDPAALITAE